MKVRRLTLAEYRSPGRGAGDGRGLLAPPRPGGPHRRGAALLPSFSYALSPMIDSEISIPMNAPHPSESHPIVFHICQFPPTQ